MGIERTGLDIIIRTPGAKESAEEVKRLGDATSGLSAPATQAGKALGDLTDKTKTTGDELKKKGDVVDQVSEKLGKKFVSAGTLAAIAIRGIYSALQLVAPAFDGLSSAAGRAWNALQGAVVSSGIVQGATAGMRVALETLAEFIEASVTPKMLALATKVRDIATAYSDAAKAANDLLRAMREFEKDEAKNATGVEKDLKGVDQWLARQKEVNGALREQEKAKVNLHERDPVKREVAINAVDRKFDAAGRNLENQAEQSKRGIINKEVSRLDEEILAAGRRIPERGTLPKLAEQAQGAASAEQAALGENRRNFVIRERIQQGAKGSMFGQDFSLANELPHPERLDAEDRMVYDYIRSHGGIDSARTAINTDLVSSRKRAAGAKAARVSAFGRLPSGVGTPSEAADYEKQIDAQMRGRIQGLQERQESLGEREGDLRGSTIQRRLLAPIQDETRDAAAEGREREARQQQQGVETREIESMVRDAMGGGRGGDVKQAVQSVLQILRETHSDAKGGWMELRQELNDQKREIKALRTIIKGNRTP